MATDTDTQTDATAPAPDADPVHEGVRYADANGIRLAYETFGDPDDPTILLVMGLGTQMVGWPVQLCEALAAAGHHVVRYDNRDIGLSTHIDAPAPSVRDMLLKRGAPYQIDDMADDAAGLLDALGIERAHVVGASMGGFISQSLTIRHPDRVRTLTLVMTSTGSRRVGRPTPEVLRRLARQTAPATRDEALDEAVETWRAIGSPNHIDLDEVRELAGISYDRAHNPAGRNRQLAAIMAQPNRTSALASITVPALVMHGLDDPLVSVTGGLALAKGIPGARFVGLHGIGHDLPRTQWRELVAEVLALIERERVAATA